MANESQFGALLRKLRTERNMLQIDLKELSGISARAISNLEVGVNIRPRAETVRMLANGLGLAGADRERFFAAARGRQWEEILAPAVLHHAPQDLPEFVGRDREIALIRRLVREHRLVTLTGVGGCGKTRLALAAASGLHLDFQDGVWFVDLVALRDPLLAPATIASALGVADTGQRSVLDALRQHLRDKRCLIVLDNYEHLLTAAPLVTALLERAQYLAMLVTSRAELQQPGEYAVEITGLALPDLRREPKAALLAQNEAVRLFTTRANVARGGIALPDETLMSVAKICRRLDGLPLAIELAAARCAVLNPDEILARLTNQLALLSNDRERVPRKHRSLQAALAWSHDLLPESCQVLFRRLSIFVGGATLATVEQICYADPPPTIEPLDGLQALAQQKLVGVVTSPGQETRYILLETVREFGLTRLRKAESERALKQRHAHIFLGLAERAAANPTGPLRMEWAQRLAPEQGNIRLALNWFTEDTDVATLLRLCAALLPYWDIFFHFDEGKHVLETALALGQGGDPGLRAAVLYNLGSLSMYQSNHAAARAYFAQCHALLEGIGDIVGIATNLRGRGNLAWRQGDYQLARNFYQQALELTMRTDDRIGAAKSRGNLGVLALDTGDFPAARRHLTVSLATFREEDDQVSTAICLENLGNVALFQGNLVEARAHFDESLALCRAQKYIGGLIENLDSLGRLAWYQGDYPRAHACFKESLLKRRDDPTDTWGYTASLDNFALLAAAEQQPIRAATLWGAASALHEAIGRPYSRNWQDFSTRTLDAARSMVGELAWQSALTHGRAMSLNAALSLALESNSNVEHH